MGTVKYTGPVASFHCPTNAEIRSLKVHFSPKQLGEGDPSPENVREIVGWDGVEAYDWTSANVSILSIPSEYKKVEYLESTGTQYIYTNVPGRYGIECRAKVLWVSGGDTTIFGARKDSSDRIMLIHQYPNYKWTLGYGASYTNLSQIDFNVIYDVESKVCSGEQYLRINGTTVYTGTDSAEYSNDFNMSLFACTYGSSNYCKLKASARIYSLNAKLDGIEVLNVVPCLRKSDNKPGMYDTVSQTFYTNAGTGEFLYGPEVSGYTENYEFGVLGKNKLNNDNEFWEVGSMDATGGKDSRTTRIRTKDFISALPNTTYTISISEGYSFAWDEFYSGIHKYYYSWKSGSYTFTTHSNVNQLFFIIKKDDATDITPSILENDCYIQLELGSTATAYEPYDPNHTAYGGYVDIINGELIATKTKVIIDDSKADLFTISNNYVSKYSCYRFSSLVSNFWNYRGNIGILFNWLKSDGNYAAWNGWVNVQTKKLLIYTPTSIDTIEKFTNYLKDHPLEISADITPVTYKLSPTQLQTFLGQNNVWSNADYVEVEYDLHETQDILNRKAFIMANQPHIVKHAAAPLQNFKTDVIAPLKECKVYFSPVQDGTGDPSPTNIRLISGWNKIQVGLPAEYQEVEYIGAEGASPYIDTGIYLTGELQTEIHYYNDKQEAFLFGSRQSASGPHCNVNIERDSTRCRLDYSNVGTGGTGFGYYSHNGEYIFRFFNRVATLTNLDTNEVRTRDGYKNANGTLFTTSPVLLFGVHTGSDQSLGTAAGALRIYSAKFWLGGTYANNAITGAELVRNFVPCIRKSDNVVGMYDTITAAFYTSQNSDTFTAGPVINSPSILVDWTNTVYGGYVDLVTGEVWKTYHEINITELGTYRTLGINKNGNTNISWFLSNHLNGPDATGYVAYSRDGYCSCAPFYVNNYYWDQKCQVNNSTVDFVIEGELTAEEVDNWIKAHAPIQIVYPLKTPELIGTITPTQLKTLRGTNNVWSNTNGNIELAYWSH